jgi:hypothetical protein
MDTHVTNLEIATGPGGITALLVAQRGPGGRWETITRIHHGANAAEVFHRLRVAAETWVFLHGAGADPDKGA